MKKDFFDYLDKLMESNENIVFLYGDLGYPRVSEFKEKYPDRVYNCGAAEQTMMDIAVGLSYAGKTPITYTITPFYYRAWETIRTYINKEQLKIIMIGAGRDDDYSKHDGYSHDASDIGGMLSQVDQIGQWYPEDIETLHNALIQSIKYSPAFINIKR